MLRTAIVITVMTLGYGAPKTAFAAESTEIVPPQAAVDYFRSHRPVYPSASRRLYEEGSVLVNIEVDTDGTSRCSVVESSDYARLDDAVVNWCPKAPRFAPARKDGKPVSYSFKLRYTFGLKDDLGADGCAPGFDTGTHPEKSRLIAAIAAIRVLSHKDLLDKAIEDDNAYDVPRALYRAINEDKSLNGDEITSMQEIDAAFIEATVARISAEQRAVYAQSDGYLQKLDEAYRCQLDARFSVEDLQALLDFYSSSVGAAAVGLDDAIDRRSTELRRRLWPSVAKVFDQAIAEAHETRRNGLRAELPER